MSNDGLGWASGNVRGHSTGNEKLKAHSLRGLMRLFSDKLYDARVPGAWEQVTNRELCLTPFGGYYGVSAGWVVVVNGSPPWGCIVAFRSECTELGVRYLGPGKGDGKRLGENQRARFEFFYDNWLVPKPDWPGTERRDFIVTGTEIQTYLALADREPLLAFERGYKESHGKYFPGKESGRAHG